TGSLGTPLFQPAVRAFQAWSPDSPYTWWRLGDLDGNVTQLRRAVLLGADALPAVSLVRALLAEHKREEAHAVARRTTRGPSRGDPGGEENLAVLLSAMLEASEGKANAAFSHAWDR